MRVAFFIVFVRKAYFHSAMSRDCRRLLVFGSSFQDFGGMREPVSFAKFAVVYAALWQKKIQFPAIHNPFLIIFAPKDTYDYGKCLYAKMLSYWDSDI